MSDIKQPPLPIPDGVGRHGDDLFYTYQMKAYARQCVLADRAARADAWQPIATAPKDGTRVLIWGPNSDTVVCYWNEWAHEPKWQPAAVEASGAQGYPDVTIRGEPTHWMPLPAAPTQERGADDE